jgi:hypothetical protein
LAPRFRSLLPRPPISAPTASPFIEIHVIVKASLLLLPWFVRSVSWRVTATVIVAAAAAATVGTTVGIASKTHAAAFTTSETIIAPSPAASKIVIGAAAAAAAAAAGIVTPVFLHARVDDAANFGSRRRCVAATHLARAVLAADVNISTRALGEFSHSDAAFADDATFLAGARYGLDATRRRELVVVAIAASAASAAPTSAAAAAATATCAEGVAFLVTEIGFAAAIAAATAAAKAALGVDAPPTPALLTQRAPAVFVFEKVHVVVIILVDLVRPPSHACPTGSPATAAAPAAAAPASAPPTPAAVEILVPVARWGRTVVVLDDAE